MNTKTPKKQPKQYAQQNPIEAIRSIAGGFKKSIKDDLMEQSVYDAWNQMTNIDYITSNSSQGELSAGQEVDLTTIEQATLRVTEQGREYTKQITNAGEKLSTRNSQELEVRMQEILIEIKSLTKSSKSLEKKVQIEVIEQGMDDPGIYHKNFLDNVLSSLTQAKENVEEGIAWFNALRSKKNSKKYGVMAKKHGTSFTLSTERTAATQTG